MSDWDKKRAEYWEDRARELEQSKSDNEAGFGCFALIIFILIIAVIATK